MNELLRTIDLYGGYKDFNILQGITMEVRQGEAVGIIGLNGSGKSTLGKAIMNMIPFRRGELLFEGQSITTLKTSQLPLMGLAIMQQGGLVFPSLSIWEHMELALGKQKNDDTEQQIERLAKIIPLFSNSRHILQRTMADKLSGGQKHQLSLAMTLALNPRLVILDEPSAGLSPRSVNEMYVIIDAIRKQTGTAVLLIEQVVAKTVEYCDRCLLIELGKIAHEFVHPQLSQIEEAMFSRNNS